MDGTLKVKVQCDGKCSREEIELSKTDKGIFDLYKLLRKHANRHHVNSITIVIRKEDKKKEG